MRNPFVHGVGGVLSADIAVPDHERELEFYSQVLTTGDAPLWREDLMNNRGIPIIGLGARTPEYDALPLQWMPHIQVADIAASVTRAITLGGQELMHGKNDDGQSQWAVLTDQNGAAFGLIPIVSNGSDNAQQNERQGCISWLSLTVPDVSTTRDFYQQVVGWNATSIEKIDGEDYIGSCELLTDNANSAAEIRQPRDDQDNIPSVWLIHIPVGDLAESLRRAKEFGGAVIKEFTDTRSAIVCDPVGVYLALQSV